MGSSMPYLHYKVFRFNFTHGFAQKTYHKRLLDNLGWTWDPLLQGGDEQGQIYQHFEVRHIKWFLNIICHPIKRTKSLYLVLYLGYDGIAHYYSAFLIFAHRYINFPTDSTDKTQNKAMNKVNSLFNKSNEKAKSLYKPRQNLSVDESMGAHKGRTPHTQYMPAKPTHWGLKVWTLAESVSGR